MAKTGIDKYDQLPGRVGLIDVDAARAVNHTEKLEKAYRVHNEADSKIERFKNTLSIIS